MHEAPDDISAFVHDSDVQNELNRFDQGLRHKEIIVQLPELRNAAAIGIYLNNRVWGTPLAAYFQKHPDEMESITGAIDASTGLSMEEFELIRIGHNHLAGYKEVDRNWTLSKGYNFLSEYINDLVKFESFGKPRYIYEEGPSSKKARDSAKFTRRLAVLEEAASSLKKDSTGLQAIRILMSHGMKTEMGALSDDKILNYDIGVFTGMEMAARDFLGIYEELTQKSKLKPLNVPRPIED